MTFTSHSQASQDLLVKLLLIDTGIAPIGRFLDVGCSEPIIRNNTYMLEQLGWTGFLFDNDDTVERLCREQRRSPFIRGDVTTLDFGKVLGGNRHFDYISLDVDENTPKALENLLKHGVTFKVATIEHDAYRFGDGPRREIRSMIGFYYPMALNVHSEGCCFEDWFLTLSMCGKIPGLCGKLEKIGMSGLDHAEVIRRLEAAL